MLIPALGIAALAGMIPLRASAQGPIDTPIASAILTPSPSSDTGEGAPLLVVLAPVQEADGFLIRGFPEQVFSRLVEIKRSDKPRLSEQEWLMAHGIEYRPATRDPVFVTDYNPSEAATRILFRLDRLTTATANVIPLRIEKGQAFVRNLLSGPYCLVLPGVPPLSTAVQIAGPVTIIRSDSWEPLLFQFYLSSLETMDPSALRAALSPAPFAQISPLIQRIRSSTALSPVELYVFYRGYYEGLALARWIETSPDARLSEFLTRMRASDTSIDQLVSEALRQQELVADIPPSDASGNPPAPGSTPPTEAPLAEAPPLAPGTAPETFNPGLAHYRAFFHIGMATLFLTESSDRTILGSSGGFVHPQEADLYAEQYRYLAREAYQWARTAAPQNPLLPVVRAAVEGGLAP